MSTTSESRIIAALPRLVILSGAHAPSGRDYRRKACPEHSRRGIWGGATSPFSQTSCRRMLAPSTSPSFHTARPACRQAGSA